MIRTSAYTLILTLLFFLMIGCDGAAGPDGEDAPAVDNLGPTIKIVQPTPGVDVTTSTMTLEAVVVQTKDSDGGDLDRIRFFVNGSNMHGTDSAVVTTAPYSYEWDFDLAGTDYGPVTVMAEAVDTLGNANRTALLLVNRRELADRDTLTDRFALGAVDELTIPKLLLELVENGNDVSYDTIRVTEAGTRFRAEEACILRFVRIYPVLRANISFPDMADYWVTLRAVEDSLRPGNVLDSIFVQPNLMLYDRWLTLDLDPMSEAARTFGAGESFFITVRPDAEPDSLDSGISIGTLFESDSTEYAAGETAYWYERPPEGEGWRPVAERYEVHGVHHLYLEAVVDYQQGAD